MEDCSTEEQTRYELGNALSLTVDSRYYKDPCTGRAGHKVWRAGP